MAGFVVVFRADFAGRDVYRDVDFLRQDLQDEQDFAGRDDSPEQNTCISRREKSA